MKYWLLKTEPDCFSIDDLAAAPKQTTCWDGVRNYQARNFMRDEMQVGDLAFFYHSNANPPAIAGIAKISREAHPDPTAWDPTDDHYDPKSTPDEPRWMMVEVTFQEKFDEPISLERLRGIEALSKMELLRKGSRLSVQPVTKAEFDAILKLVRKKAARGG